MKEYFNNLFKNFKNTKNVNKKDYVIYGIIAFFLFVSFIYWDLYASTSHSINFIEVIFQNRIMDFYKINYNFEINGVAAMVCYDLPIYPIFMVWNFPLWILQHFFNVDVTNSLPCILWMKGILLLFLFSASAVIRKIGEELGISKNLGKWMSLVFISSPLVFSSIFILSQYDIIPIFFMLLGLLFYIKNDNKKFILFFSIAIPMKLFALFVFIPLLLLKEKKITKICLKTATSLWLLIISKIITSLMPYYKLSTSGFGNQMIDKLFNSSLLKINFGSASLFVAAYAGICIYCYIKNTQSKEETNKYAIYIPFVVFTVFFLFVSFYPYWIIYIVPFFSIILFQNKKHFKINLLLDMVYSFSSLYIMSSYYYWCFGAKQLENMVIPKLFGIKSLSTLKYPNINSIFIQYKLDIWLPAVFGFFFIVSLVYIILNFPKKGDKENTICIERSVIWLRMLIIIPFAFLMIFCYYR